MEIKPIFGEENWGGGELGGGGVLLEILRYLDLGM